MTGLLDEQLLVIISDVKSQVGHRTANLNRQPKFCFLPSLTYVKTLLSIYFSIRDRYLCLDIY